MRIYDDWQHAQRTVLRRRDLMALDEAPEAIRYLAAGRARGKIVIIP